MEKRLYKTIVLFLVWVCLLSTVEALGVAPDNIPITVERGKETVVSRRLFVMNSDTTPIRLRAIVTGSISPFVSVEPSVIDLPAGPGLHSEEPSPYRSVDVVFKVPREVSKLNYEGSILFKEEPTGGGMISTAAQLRVTLSLSFGGIAQAEFPLYLNTLMVLLIVFIVISLVVWRFKK